MREGDAARRVANLSLPGFHADLVTSNEEMSYQTLMRTSGPHARRAASRGNGEKGTEERMGELGRVRRE